MSMHRSYKRTVHKDLYDQSKKKREEKKKERGREGEGKYIEG